MAATMKDIAKLVGVSINTVSHALKNKPDISREMTRRIQQAAADLGYRPNLSARNLVLKKSYIIGLGVTEIDNPVRVEFCEKLRVLAQRDGYRLITVSLDRDRQTCPEEFPGGYVDGYILGALWDLPEEAAVRSFIADCRKHQIPTVVFGAADSFPGDGVKIDLQASVRTLTRHLLDRGYQDIALFANSISEANFRGYAQAMDETGLGGMVRRIELPAADGTKQRADLSRSQMDNAYAAMERFLASGEKLPRAVIAANDLAAFGVLRSLRGHGISVPEQCAVAGVDNTEFGKYANPALTSIGFDRGRCAEAVWKLMIRRLNKLEKRPAVRTAVRQKLFIREST